MTGPIPGSASSSAAVAELRLTRPPGGLAAASRDALRHEHLHPVRERGGEVDRGGVGRRGRSARTGDRVGDALALGQPVEAGPPDRARDVHDELRRGGGRLGDERLRRLLGGGTRAGQRASCHGQQRERGCREEERPPARHGQGGHVPSVPGQRSRRVNASATIVCRIRARRRS